MTGAPMRGDGTRRILRPQVVLPLLAAAVILVILVVPGVGAGGGSASLSSYANSQLGGKLFYELAGRLGWVTERRETPFSGMSDSSTIQVVLAPDEPIGAAETHQLLESVRRGGGLLTVINGPAPLADSLRLGGASGGTLVSAVDERSCMAINESPGIPLWPGSQPYLRGVDWRGPPPSVPVNFGMVRIPARGGPELRPAAVGVALGRGRVVVAMDPDLFRNDAVRVCRAGLDVLDVRMLEYLSADGARWRLVFDEYHHGYGAHPGSLRAVTHYLAGVGSGRLLGQLALAGLLALFAGAPRLILPRDADRPVRRSPLEHAEALGTAYEEVHASRTVIRRLLGGVRRRADARFLLAPGRAPDDEAFLDALAARTPDLAGDVARVRAALATRVSDAELAAAGASLERIEHFLITSPRS